MEIRKSVLLGKKKQPKRISFTPFGKEEQDVLWGAYRAWSNLDSFRKRRERSRKYLFGDQWSDKVKNEDGETVSEEQYIRSQGKVPLKNNLIRQLVKSVLGQYRNGCGDPVCISRDRDEQVLGEMMTVALQYAYTLNRLTELDSRTMEEFLVSGTAFQKTYYGWKNGKSKTDLWVDMVNPSRIFFDADMEDPRHWDCKLIGELHDLSLSEVVSIFARNTQEREAIKEIFNTSSAESFDYVGDTGKANRAELTNFYSPVNRSLCRVIEVWRQETKPRYRCHDVLNGEYYKIDIEELKFIEEENAKRIRNGQIAGVDPEDVATIEVEWFMDVFWYYRYMTPTGHVLRQGESPYWHKEHPYSFKLHPFMDGQIHSFVEDVIDQQRYINRLIMMVDFIMGSSAKGVLMMPEEAVSDSMDMNKIATEWAKYNGVIYYKSRGAQGKPEQVSTNATNVGAYELLNIQLKLLDDISGIHGAIQGKSTGAGTAASLYAQQAENSSINLVDLLDSFKSFREDRDYKIVKNIQQYYEGKRYMNIVGANYSDEARLFDSERVRNVEFDMAITESQNSPIARAMANELLLMLFEKGILAAETLLEIGHFPYADRILQKMNTAKEQMEKGQMPDQLSPMLQNGNQQQTPTNDQMNQMLQMQQMQQLQQAQ